MSTPTLSLVRRTAAVLAGVAAAVLIPLQSASAATSHHATTHRADAPSSQSAQTGRAVSNVDWW